jgi:menaquinone reductase, molybdopterin-binding-like subunit
MEDGMGIRFTRRDVLFAATGSAAGLVLSPVPWKLLGDSAIWTQRSRFAPETLRGEVSTRFAACTLCPAGCALRARCVGTPGIPVSLTGVAGHPVTHGALCATGFAVHHLARHPLRLTGPAQIARRKGGVEAVSRKADVVLAAIADAVRSARAAKVPLAVLDLRPGRMASLECRRLLAGIPGAIHIIPTSRDASTLEAIRARLEGAGYAVGPLGIDLDKPSTIVSFGAPLREGWGTPGTVPVIVTRQNQGNLRLVQVEAHRSPTAEGADRWLPIRPGTEAAVALGLSHVLLADGLVVPEVTRRARDLDDSFRSSVAPFEPSAVERISGIPAAVLRSLAHDVAQGPSLAIGSGAPGSEPLGREEESAVAALNLLLGNPGPSGSVVARRELPSPTLEGSLDVQVPLAELADGSVGVLIIDGAAETVPWTLIASKLTTTATVVSLSPWLAGPALHASWAVPAPAPLELLDEVLTPAGAPMASWGLALPLVAPPENAMAPAVFFSRLAAALGSPASPPEGAEALLKRRAAAIVTAGRGKVFVSGGTSMAIADAGGPDGLYEKLSAGGAWTDDPLPAPRQISRFTLLPPTHQEVASLAAVATLGRPERQGQAGALLDPEGYVGATGAAPEPAILGKLGRESLLRTSAMTRASTPVTIREA